MCTFDIVPSLGPQSQVHNRAEASVFVQSSVPSTRFAIDTHHRYRLLYYSSTNVPTGTVLHPPPVLFTHYRFCSGLRPTHNPRLPIRRSEKRSARPRRNLITNSYKCGGILASKDYIIYMFPYPNLTHKVAIACINNDMYGKQGKQ